MRHIGLGLLAWCFSASAAFAQCMEQQRLTASDGTEHDLFGSSVAVDGDVAVIGAIQDDDVGLVAGSAYVFRFNGTSWVEEQKLTAPDAAVLDHDILFGRFVAVDGDTIVVGGALDLGGDSNGIVTSISGAAYVYRFNGTSWIQEQKLTAKNPAAFDFFGSSVAVDGDTAVIGAPACGFVSVDCSMNSSAVYVFVRSRGVWTEQAKLTVSGPTLFDQFFGSSVAINGHTALVGGALDIEEDAQTAVGSSYIFVRSGEVWTEQAKLTVSGPGVISFIQTAGLDLDGDTAIVGSLIYDQGFPGPPLISANVFARTGEVWTEQAKLTVPDPAPNQMHLGALVAVDGNTAVLGVPTLTFSDVGILSASGSVYVFARTGQGWTEVSKLLPPGGGAFDQFGPLDLDGDTVLVGALGEDSSTGAAYVFDVGRCDADEDGLLDDWEANGIPYTDGNGVEQRYMLPGANRLHKDLFVEVDAMTGFGLSDAAVMLLEEAFNKAPRSNPDESDGITLHVFRDPTKVSLSAPACSLAGIQAWRDGGYGTLAEHGDIALLEAKAKAYRYCIVADTAGSTTLRGCGQQPGDNFVIFINGLNDEEQAAVFMHELGHNLGLGHGGGDNVNGKPNYPSIMNYVLNYRSPWNDGFWKLDYSRAEAGEFSSLNESSLDEHAGIGLSAGRYSDFLMPFGVNELDPGGNVIRSIRYVPLDDSTGLWQGGRTPTTDYGDITETMFQDGRLDSGVQQDLNHFGNAPQELGIPSTPRSFPQTLTPFDDWANVGLPLAAALGNLAPSSFFPTDELTTEAQEWIDANFPLPPGACPADLDGDGDGDLADYLELQRCFTGPGIPTSPDCLTTDLDGDGDADLADFVIFQASFGCP